MTSNWKDWTGGEKPPTGHVDIRLRSGREVRDTAASKWLWGRPRHEIESVAVNDNGGTIVAYREVGEAV